MDKSFYPSFTNDPYEKTINFNFLVDAGNAPTLQSSPRNNYVASVTRTGTGTYQLVLADAIRTVATSYAELNLATPSGNYAQMGPVTNVGVSTSVGLPTFTIYTLNSAGAAADPPAQSGGNVFISGSITFIDVSAQ